MSKNLIKRILTSAVLIGLLIFFVFNNQYTWLFSLIIVSLLCWVEFINLFKKILKKNFNLRDIYIALSFGYLSLFIICSLILYNLGFAFFILSVCIFSDIGGYIVGNIVGGKKLTKISPNKTYSGMFGSFFLSIISANIFFTNLHYFGITGPIDISVEMFILVILISLTSQIGDLIISYFKRLSKVKNTGKIIPGHGGLLDRIDGMIFAFPFIYIYIYI